MAWMQCRGCSAKFAVGLLRCPQCQAVSELYAVPEEVIEAEREAAMPKITVGGGASNALGVVEGLIADEAEAAPVAAEPETAADVSAATDPGVPPADPEPEQSDTAPTPKAATKRAAKKSAAAAEPAVGE